MFMEKEKSRVILILAATVKFLLLGVILWLIVVKLPIHIAAFLVGLSTMVWAVCIYGIFDLLRGRAS